MNLKYLCFLLAFLIAILGYSQSMEIGRNDNLIITVNILGQVKNPGEFKVEYGTNVIQAISKAGGFGDYANMKNIKIVRIKDGKKIIIEVNVKKFFDKNNVKVDIPILENGDVIMIGKNVKRVWASFVTFVSQIAIIINVIYLISLSK
jgi:hypothetical protein